MTKTNNFDALLKTILTLLFRCGVFKDIIDENVDLTDAEITDANIQITHV